MPFLRDMILFTKAHRNAIFKSAFSKRSEDFKMYNVRIGIQRRIMQKLCVCSKDFENVAKSQNFPMVRHNLRLSYNEQ